MELSVKTLAGKAAGKIELDDAIFGIDEIRGDILQRTVRWQLARRQAGTHKVKSRSEVNRTTKKSIKQKGSGGARHGSRNAPIFVGGGAAHGPRVRSHAHDLPKKIRKMALAHALSSKFKDSAIMVIDKAEMDAGKTKDLVAAFKGLGISPCDPLVFAVIGNKYLSHYGFDWRRGHAESSATYSSIWFGPLRPG
jgi:large subunit ribosomal protein L4